MVSPWSNPLPLEEYTTTKVLICAYQDRWVPITFSGLAEAIRLYHKALLHGAEIFVFPPDLAPWNSQRCDIYRAKQYNAIEPFSRAITSE